MANLNTTAIAEQLLGTNAQRVYHQDLTTHGNQPRLKKDKLGAGDFTTVQDTLQNVHYSYDPQGLLIEFDRPISATSLGVFASIDLQNLSVPVPLKFVLTGTFISPRQILNPQSVGGNYAASLLFTFDNVLNGATSQLNTGFQRLNIPGTNVAPNRPAIAGNYITEVANVQNPSPFTVILMVDRTANASTGEARLYVKDDQADRYPFTFLNQLTSASVLKDFRIGLGTAGTATNMAGNYRVSMRVLEFEVWVPAPTA